MLVHKSRCIRLTAGPGEACTPTAIDAVGAVCVIGNATLVSVGRERRARRWVRRPCGSASQGLHLRRVVLPPYN